MLDDWTNRASQSWSSILRAVLQLASLLAALAMVGLFAAGLLQLGKSLLYGLGLATFEGAYTSGAIASIKAALKGLELFFLAPLPYVVLRAIRRYAGHTDAELYEPKVRNELVMAKTFSLTLLLALIASAVAEQALSVDGLTYEMALSGAAVILVLGLFILGLKRTLH